MDDQQSSASARPQAATGSQTLDRGLRALEVLAESEEPMSISALAHALDVHRSNAYRILRTLEHRRFVLRDESGLIRIGPRLASIARGASPSLHAAALPELTELANTLGMTTFIAVLDADVVITLLSIEPNRSHASVAQRPGARHSLTQGAPSHAIESSLTPREHREHYGESELSDSAKRTIELGYSISRDEVIHGLTSVAVPLRLAGEPAAALAVVTIGVPDDLDDLVMKLRGAAGRISYAFR